MLEPVFVAITRRVKSGREVEFEQSIQRFFKDSFDSEGVAGVQLIRPTPESSSRDYGILRTFESAEDEKAFYSSSIFKNWESEVAPLVEGKANRRKVYGLDLWMRRGGDQKAPASWKVALVSWIGVWPTVYVVSMLLSSLLSSFPKIVVVGIDTFVIVLTLHWFVMPLLTRAMSGWLHSESKLDPNS